MRSVIIKSVYAGLGLLNSGKESIEHLGRELARQADLSEKDGQKVAHQLRARTDKIVTKVHKGVETEIKKAVDLLHASVRADIRRLSPKKRKTTSARGRTHKRHKPGASKHSK